MENLRLNDMRLVNIKSKSARRCFALPSSAAGRKAPLFAAPHAQLSIEHLPVAPLASRDR